MIEIEIKTTEGVMHGLELKGHASEYSGEITQKLCFAITSVTEAISLLDPDNIIVNERGHFIYDLCIVSKVNNKDRTHFSYLELLVTQLTLLSLAYEKSFIIKEKKTNG